MKKTAITILALFLCLAAISSCGLVVINYPSETEIGETAAETQTQAETEAPGYKKITKDTTLRSKEYLDTIENADWNGGVVKIASVYPLLSDTQSSPKSISTLIEERNNAVTEKLGVEIYTEATDEASLFAALSASMTSGQYYADLLMIPQDTVASFAAAGLLFNLRSLPNFDLSAPYFNASSAEAGAAGYNSYAVAGEMTCSLHTFHAMFFSRDAFEKLGLELPYSLVKNGKWTYDAYFTLAAQSGEYAPIATGAHGDEAADAAYIALGGKFISAGVKKAPTVAADLEKLEGTVELIRRVFTNERALTGERGGIAAFSGAMFMADRLDAMSSLADSGTTWGVLPIPKASEEQEKYITPASADSLVVAVPAVLFSDERASQVLRALAAASAGRVPQAFIINAQNTMLRDNSSALMLDTIVSDIRYDFAYTAGTMFPSAASASYNAVRNAVFAGENATEAIEYYREACERDLSAAFPME